MARPKHASALSPQASAVSKAERASDQRPSARAAHPSADSPADGPADGPAGGPAAGSAGGLAGGSAGGSAVATTSLSRSPAYPPPFRLSPHNLHLGTCSGAVTRRSRSALPERVTPSRS